MTTLPVTRPRAQDRPVRAPATSRLGALVRAELILLLRNRTALFNAVALAPLTVLFVATVGGDLLGPEPAHAAGTLLALLLAMALLVVVYYNLTTTFVARREELVLKRLLTGDVARWEIVLAYAVPAAVITLAQLVLGWAALALLVAPPRAGSPWWLLVAVVGGTGVFTLLAVASSGLTRTVETAQLTTLPMLVVAPVLSGLTMPLHLLPTAVETVASWTPMYAVVRLVQHGFDLTTPGGQIATGSLAGAAQPVACLAVWAVLGVLAVRRWMRWEPRR